ncbi:MAG TPA: hypothetical protein PLM41_09810, partial [Saprospiraceae bacterium]|nr:hypothetical protein [Saprospiraceae bacterium]
AAIYIFQNILEQAIKYEFIDLAADVSKILRREYIRSEYDEGKNKYYTSLHRMYEKKRHFENIALDYYEEVASHYAKSRSVNIKLSEEADQYYSELYPFLKEVDTSSFYYYTFNICIIKHFSKNDISNALKTANQSFYILRERQNTNRSMLTHVCLQQLACYIHLRAEESTFHFTFNYFLDHSHDKDISWFRGYESYFYYSIYRKKYIDAIDIYRTVLDNGVLLKLNGYYLENWLLMAGYLHLLAQLDILDSQKVLDVVGLFRYSKLINEVEVINKDKEGMNIPLLLLPILYELAQAPQRPHQRNSHRSARQIPPALARQ